MRRAKESAAASSDGASTNPNNEPTAETTVAVSLEPTPGQVIAEELEAARSRIAKRLGVRVQWSTPAIAAMANAAMSDVHRALASPPPKLPKPPPDEAPKTQVQPRSWKEIDASYRRPGGHVRPDYRPPYRGATVVTAAPPARGYELYVGDLYAAGKGLVKAEFELHALQRYHTDPELAAAVTEMAVATSELVALYKWVQGRLIRIDWNERPQLHPVPEVPGEPVLTLVRGGVR